MVRAQRRRRRVRHLDFPSARRGRRPLGGGERGGGDAVKRQTPRGYPAVRQRGERAQSARRHAQRRRGGVFGSVAASGSPRKRQSDVFSRVLAGGVDELAHLLPELLGGGVEHLALVVLVARPHLVREELLAVRALLASARLERQAPQLQRVRARLEIRPECARARARSARPLPARPAPRAQEAFTTSAISRGRHGPRVGVRVARVRLRQRT